MIVSDVLVAHDTLLKKVVNHHTAAPVNPFTV
jgi:hypothetical protein